MNADALRALQAPLKDRYRQQPQAAFITLSAEGRLGEGVSCSVQTGQALVKAGLHPASGGDGLSACSGDMLLQALVVGFIGYGIGVGMAGAFTLVTKYSESELAAILPWELLVISLVAMLMTVMLGSVLSLRRVITVSPGAVFSSAS